MIFLILDCTAAPTIPHAEVITSSADNELFYTCADGYTRVGGDNLLRCQVREGVLTWDGDHINCQPLVKQGKYLYAQSVFQLKV